MSGTLKIGGKTLATHDTAANEISFHSDVMATTAQVQGTHTTFSGSHSDTVTTINLASVSGISAGDYVVGEGITPDTTVSSVGASSVVISAGLDTDGVGIAGGEPISFYKSTKALSPGLVAGQLCRAWVNFNGTGTVAIRAAYNVSSVADLGGTAKYAINFTTAMPDTYYSWVASAGFDNFAQQIWVSSPSSVTLATWKTTTQIQLQAVYANNTANSDPPEFNVAIFR